MPSTRVPIKGILLKDEPEALTRCGMSHATFAQHRFTSEWFELSDQGQIIGSALDLDFYRQDSEPGSKTQWQGKTQELSRV